MAKNNPLIVIITAFLVLSLMLSLVKAAATNITTDQHALLALKDRITYDPTNLLAKNWSTSSSICTWIGVTCGVRHHRVTVLNMSYFGLAGTLPPQLGNLSFLQVLAIKNNSFSGSLPDELAQLRRLKRINFMFNIFQVQIPSWFGTLSKLQYLFLSHNNLVGTIPPSLGNMSSLQVLDLSYNQLSGTIPSSIFQISSLERLNLSYNQLSDSFPSIIFNLPSLQDIRFSSNSLTGGLPSDIFNYLPNLKILALSKNMFDGQIPSTISKCQKLQILSLSINNFTGYIPKEIGNMTMLKELYLGFNKLHEYGLEGIVSIRGDVYSFGILLMETFTRKKPTDNMFEGGMSLKCWVKEALPNSITEVADTNLLEGENFTATMDCISSILELAVDCSADSPEKRLDITNVLTTLANIKTRFQKSMART